MREVKKLTDSYIINDESYFADQMYVTNSMLKQLETGSTKKLEHYLNSEHKETESLLVGSAFHCYILEPDEFDSRYVYEPKFDKRTKLGKESYAEFLETVGNKKCVPWHYETKFETIANNLSRHKVANSMITNSIKKEVIHFWEDVETGVKCKGKIDIEGSDYIADLKSTSKGADLQSFIKFAEDYKVTQQAAFYTNGAEKKNFYFIVCELKAPFGIGVYKIGDKSMENGNHRVSSALGIYKKFINEDMSTDHNEDKIIVI